MVLQDPGNLKVPRSLVHLNTKPQNGFKGSVHIKIAEPTNSVQQDVTENLKVPQGLVHLNTKPQNVFKGSVLIKIAKPTN